MFQPSELATAIGPMKWLMGHGESTDNFKPIKRSASQRAVAVAMLELLRDGCDCRRKKVRSVRRSVRNRHYENDLKLTVAVERLLHNEPGVGDATR